MRIRTSALLIAFINFLVHKQHLFVLQYMLVTDVLRTSESTGYLFFEVLQMFHNVRFAVQYPVDLR